LPLYVILYAYVNFWLGCRINDTKGAKPFFYAGIIINISQLVLLRYASFSIDPLISLFGSGLKVSVISEIILPIGISYYTLQGIGYLINVKMGWEKAETNFLHLLLYITFFPKFLSGPIERSNHFLTQIEYLKGFSPENIISGFRIILVGLFKKIVIANQLAPYIINTYKDIDSAPGNTLWLILIIQPLYLYFDFSGYTDIAIGSSKLFGINLLPNFNRPFFSKNMTIFWKRFHVSLSSWFNDYIFRQLSFKLRRWGVIATLTALLITWTLFGIWHGAGWTFMFLGLLQALAITYEFFTKKWRAIVFSKMPEKVGLWIGRLSTYLFFCIALTLFFAKDMRSVISFFKKLFELNFSIPLDGISTGPFMLLIYIPVLWIIELVQEDYSHLYQKIEAKFFSDNKGLYLRWTIYSVILTTLIIEGFKNQQFVYANF
jgi:D-alanyl-lipoteichoic acid acyltransferase DltB (MBOAT superfamily)